MGPAPQPCTAHLAALILGQAMGRARFRAPECKLGRRAARGPLESPECGGLLPPTARGARPPSSSAAAMRSSPRASRHRSVLLFGHLAVTIAAMRLVGWGGRAWVWDEEAAGESTREGNVQAMKNGAWVTLSPAPTVALLR